MLKAVVFLIVLYVSSYRRVHFSRAVLFCQPHQHLFTDSLHLCFVIIMWILVEHLISKWALSISQWQLLGIIFCFWADPLPSSCMWFWMSEALHSATFNIHLSGCSAVWLLHGWCHTKLLPSRHMLWVHHATLNQLTMSSNSNCYLSTCSKYTMQWFTVSSNSKPHRKGACVFNCNLPPALSAEWPGSFMCPCSNMGVKQIPE